MFNEDVGINQYMQNQRLETGRMNAMIDELRSEVATVQRRGDSEVEIMRGDMKRASDNMITMGSGEVLQIRQNADIEVTSARAQTRYYEQEFQELRDELNARNSSAPDPSSYTKLVCELDQARTEVKDRQQHIGDLNVMLRLSEEQLERERRRGRWQDISR